MRSQSVASPGGTPTSPHPLSELSVSRQRQPSIDQSVAQSDARSGQKTSARAPATIPRACPPFFVAFRSPRSVTPPATTLPPACQVLRRRFNLETDRDSLQVHRDARAASRSIPGPFSLNVALRDYNL
ncbi:hypothetical protein GWI33_000150 [Rhynchophorus ferrugineus]|uniref:Uncharacterized protein n=1 Tax=Rhynchophorus ferrugineus TaxID=354439 RepID=A0A834IYX4_RHYFE|nr:hypothetical protein GWI33_000150 [Rhynchophorus ferrugineus]